MDAHRLSIVIVALNEEEAIGETSQTLRRVWPKLDALASTNDREQVTYDAWLSQPKLITRLLAKSFVPEWQFSRFGKFLGQPRGSEAVV